MGRRCLFCDVRPGITQEHTWPTWFSEVWLNLARTTGGTGDTFQKEHSLTSSKGELRSFVGDSTVKGVCVTCNTGWMSDLEGATKPVLMDLMMGTQRLLSPRDQRTLSKWAVLKSLVFILTTPEATLPSWRYRQFFRHGPRSVSVQLFICQMPYFGGTCKTQAIYHGESSTASSFQAVFRLGYAVLNVLGHPVRISDPHLAHQRAQFSLTIWPPGPTIQFPPPMAVTPSQVETFMRKPPSKAEGAS